jgi:predicted RNase H-like HicB family nuclease
VTSPVLPELVTAGATVDEAIENVRDAITAVLELYEDLGRPLPDLTRYGGHEEIVFEHLLATE